MQVHLNSKTQPLTQRNKLDNESKFYNDMLPEEYMIYCARISSPDNRLNHETAPKLLKYLIDNKHWSPLEMISFGFEIETSRAIAQQILRHRSFSFQEFSQRYAKVTAIEPVELRYKATKNRQSSSDVVTDGHITRKAEKAMAKCFEAYNELIDLGIATECARMVLPLATQTTIVMHGTLRSWIHFLDQRCSDHAQKEIRCIAFAIRNLLIDEVPWTAAALEWQKEYDV